MQIINNLFKGGGDDGLDLDGTDAHIEGNVFMNFQLNTSRATTANAIATGLPQSGESNRTQITVVRNVFMNSDHGILLKEDAFATVEHNVFIGMDDSAIQFNESGGTAVNGPGKGAALDGNIFVDVGQLFSNLVNNANFQTELTINRSLLPNDPLPFGSTTIRPHDLGVGNISGDPLFVDAANGDFRLQSNSPAIRTAAGDLNMGHLVSGQPIVTPLDGLVDNGKAFQVSGPGITAYRYRLSDSDPYSDLTAVSTPIILDDLIEGEYTLQVIGQNDAGEWYVGDTPAFHQSSMDIIAAPAVRTGESWPMVVRVLDELGTTNSNISAPIQVAAANNSLDSDSVQIKKGVGSFAPTVTAASDFSIQTSGVELAASHFGVTVLDASTPSQTYSGTLAQDTVWDASTDRHITGELLVPSGVTLTIQPGTRVILDDQVNVRVFGTIESNGTAAAPVVFNSVAAGRNWGGIEVNSGQGSFQYTFFTNAGSDSSKNFGHSNSQPVLFANSATLNCDNCFVINNVGKGFGATNSYVTISHSVVSDVDTGGEFVRSVVQVADTWVKNIPNSVRQFQDDDNDGFYFNGAHPSGEFSTFQDSFIVDTRDDGIDHNGANLNVINAWIEGAMHEGIATSNTNSANIINSVFTRNNQGIEAGYGGPNVTVQDSATVRNDAGFDTDAPITAGIRFGDGYDGNNGAYTGHIDADNVVSFDNDVNGRNYDGSIPGPQAGALDITNSLTNDADYDGADGNLAGVPVFSRSMHLLRGSAGFTAGPDGLPMGRTIPAVSYTFTFASNLPDLRLNEVAVAVPSANGATGYVELFNDSESPVDLTGYQLVSSAKAFVIPDTADSVISVGGFVRFELGDANVNSQFADLSLDLQGDTLRLVGPNGTTIDELTFGRQLSNTSVGRSESGRWELNSPSPLQPNVIANVGTLDAIRINEWTTGANAFLELSNSANLPIDIGGLVAAANGQTDSLPELWFLAANEHFAFTDNLLSIDLAADSGSIRLTDRFDQILDQTNYAAQPSGFARGRSPDTTGDFALLSAATPGAANATPISSTSVTLRQGVAGYAGMTDAWIQSSDPNTNFGDDVRMDADGDSSGGAEWSLLRWDLASIPADVLLQNVSVSLTVNNASSDAYQLYALSTPWVEDEVTWNRPSSPGSWAAAGTGVQDRAELLGSLTTNGNTGVHTVEFTSAGLAVVQGWLSDPSSNHGMILYSNSATDGLEIRSSEYATVSQRPELELSYVELPNIRGDFNGDGTVDVTDVDLFCNAYRGDQNPAPFDLTGDNGLSEEDRDVLIFDILGTTYGDSNLDGIFNSSDLVQVFQVGEYEDNAEANSTWADGDWNCDGEFNTQDLVIAFQAGGFSANSLPMLEGIVEPLTQPAVRIRQQRLAQAAAIDAVFANDRIRLNS
ncbi:MAG: DNRLRE domain-containing protein [Pirellulaceae bacterium]